MKILIIQQKMIGDVLTSSILFEALRIKYPEVELHYLIYPHTRPVVEHNPHIDRLIEYDKESLKSPLAFLKFAKSLKQVEYDIVIDVYSKIGSSLLSFLSEARKRISYRKWYTSFLYTDTFNYREKLETNSGFAIENRMQLLQAIDKSFPLELKPKIYLIKEEKQAARERINREGIPTGKPLFMIGVLGSSEEKTYPLPYMAQVLDKIVAMTGASLLFNYIPSQKAQVEELLSYCEQNTRTNIYINLYGKSLREFLALTSHCDALIGNEGGAINMAKALNIPTFAIFSPQINKEVWALYEGDLNRAVHLADFKPQVIKNSKLSNAEKYLKFKPEFIWKELQLFLNRIS
ncbi:glycosyltransferase family 9 protein [Salegentibacter sp. HM20]